MSKGVKLMLLAGVLIAMVAVLFAARPYARADEAEEMSEAQEWKAQLESDKAAVSSQKAEIKSNAESARAEEKDLLDRIKTAQESGDRETAKSLRQQLKSTHRENVSEMKTDKAELKEARQQLKSDSKAARKDRDDRNDDGMVDRAEKKASRNARGGRR